MGTYATITALQIHMVGVDLTTTGSGSTFPAACITRAESRINGVLARRYDLSQSYFQTTTSIPPLVREWTAMLAAGYAWKDKSRGGAGKESMARGKGLIDDVMADLTALSKFELQLVDTAGSLIADMSNTSSRVLCNTTNYEPTFDEGDPLLWRVDPDKRDDINDAKD